ncbi:unnamed protein product [Urochloa decumbens]|uniref:DUF1618 domain-containing protein n=1 Tax=Urochloa decumbens TaxID=240449 RepID=A0ABC8Y1A5_9POAL
MEQRIRMPKRRHGERDSRRAAAKKHRRGQRLYLVFDDWPWGYSIREVDCSTAAGGGTERRLPRPFIRLEAPRGFPLFFSAVGTRIVATHRRNPWDDDSVPDGFLPIVDVRSRGVTFGPGQVRHDLPIYLPVGGDGLFALDTITVRMLSFKPLWPPRLETESSADVMWAWRELSRAPFNRLEVTSYAVHPDDHTILVSTTRATFTFDADKLDTEDLVLVWTRLGEWSLPFSGRAYFVGCLDAFVGLSKDPATPGHLCSCSCELVATDDGPPAWKLGKEKLFSEDPAETHVGATLLYMGGSEFCLVQCVSVEDGNTSATQAQEDIEEEEAVSRRSLRCSHLYRLTTFSLSYNNGDMTTGETCHVRCYRVPKATTERFLRRADPVAFWL